MRIGIAQINTIAGAFDATIERMVAFSHRAAEQNVDVLLFPLAALAGVEPVPFADAASFMRDLAEAVTTLSEQLACPAIVPVPMDMDANETSYDALLLKDGEVRPLCMLARAGHASVGAQPARQDICTFELAGETLTLAFSYDDLDMLDGNDQNGTVTLFFSGYPFALDDPSSAMAANLENARYVSDAQDIGSWLVGVASLGGYGEQVFTGSSFVVSPGGKLVSSAPAFEEALLVADVGYGAPLEAAGSLVPEMFDAPFHLWQALSLGIHDYVTKLGQTDVALCLDGTLAANMLVALASDAVGPLHVHALVGASAGAQAASCRELARRLHVNVTTASGHPSGFDARDFDELELAQLARENDALALSSLDKTALALGAPARSLSCARLCPLGDVYRSDVLDMAHVRNTISPIFRRVGLTDADFICVPVEGEEARVLSDEADITFVDEILLGYIEYDRPFFELVSEAPGEAKLIEALLAAQRRAESWRRSLPPVLTMSTHTLDEVRFAVGTNWHDTHLDEFEIELGTFGNLQLPSESMPAAMRKPSPATDLESTLAMLRDFAEQGGFVPHGQLLEDNPNLKKAVQEGLDLGSLGWMNPFSEN